MVSVIIPVYNVENYLERCVRSVLMQSYSDYEVILVDDGSTDRSGIICDHLASTDPRIRVFHKENGGVCSARNMGIENAKGEYVYFADSDDELIIECLSILYNNIQGKDMAIGGYVVCDSQGDITYDVKTRTIEVISPNEAICLMIKSRYYDTLGMLWHSLFKSSIIKKNHLRFHDDIYVYEDNLFTIEYLCKCSQKISFNTVPVYKYYNNRPDSTMSTIFSSYNVKAMSAFNARMHAYLAIKDYQSSRKARVLARRALFTCYRKQCSYLTSCNHEDDINYLTNQLFSVVHRTDYFCYMIREFLKRLYYKVF